MPHHRYRTVVPLVAAILVGCNGEPTPTPDPTATLVLPSGPAAETKPLNPRAVKSGRPKATSKTVSPLRPQGFVD